MSRLSRHQAFMETAFVWAKRSTCCRLNVGAVVVINDRIVSHGYNGSPPGAPHCRGNECPGIHGCRETIHAEQNALARVPRGLEDAPKQIYTTHSPCLVCADSCRYHLVNRVYFSVPFRDLSGLDYLIDSKIEVFQVLPAGYVMQWSSKQIIEIV